MFLLYVIAAALLVGASVLIFRELLIADGPTKPLRRPTRSARSQSDRDVSSLRRAA